MIPRGATSEWIAPPVTSDHRRLTVTTPQCSHPVPASSTATERVAKRHFAPRPDGRSHAKKAVIRASCHVGREIQVKAKLLAPSDARLVQDGPLTALRFAERCERQANLDFSPPKCSKHTTRPSRLRCACLPCSNVLFKYACAHQAARVSSWRPSQELRNERVVRNAG